MRHPQSERHFWLSYITTVIFTGVFLSLLTWIIYPIFRKEEQAISPLSSFLTLQKNNQVSTLDLWLPSIQFVKESPVEKPQILAKAALIYDLTTGETLFAKNPKEKLPMASLTKVMTAIIALENKKKNDRYLVGRQALVGENSMGLSEGEILSLEELLHGLILYSGNDAAEVLADSFSLEREGFIKAMNDKAKSLGLVDTHFTNPTGLEGEGKQFTTAYDLLVITRYALSNFPLFQKVVSTYEYHLPYSEDHKELYLYNETNLLTSYPGVKGVKDGYTPEAGLCLITYLDYGGYKIVGVILGSNNRREEMKELLDYFQSGL